MYSELKYVITITSVFLANIELVGGRLRQHFDLNHLSISPNIKYQISLNYSEHGWKMQSSWMLPIGGFLAD